MRDSFARRSLVRQLATSDFHGPSDQLNCRGVSLRVFVMLFRWWRGYLWGSELGSENAPLHQGNARHKKGRKRKERGQSKDLRTYGEVLNPVLHPLMTADIKLILLRGISCLTLHDSPARDPKIRRLKWLACGSTLGQNKLWLAHPLSPARAYFYCHHCTAILLLANPQNWCRWSQT